MSRQPEMMPAGAVLAGVMDEGSDSQVMVSLFVHSKKIYPRAVAEWFALWRCALVGATQVLFYGLPVADLE